MRRRLGWIAIAWLLAMTGVALVAYGGASHAASLDDRARAVEVQLRCPVCQGESVADSSSDIARAMRADIRRRLAAGQPEGTITAFYASKYGEWILLAPPASGVGNFAWLAPPLLLLGGIGLLGTLVLQWRTRGQLAPAPAREEYLERVRAEVARDEPE